MQHPLLLQGDSLDFAFSGTLPERLKAIILIGI